MNLNDVLTRQNVITKLSFSKGDKELSKELKVKIMRMRMTFNKFRKQFDDDVKEFTEQLVPQELRDLSEKTDRTSEEETRFNELNNKVNSEYQEFLVQKGFEEIKDISLDTFSVDEYADILDINSDDVEINGNKISSADFMEIVYTLFVKE